VTGDVISLCDRTGVAVRPWAEAGFRCWCIDIQHPMSGRVDGPVRFQYGDVRSWTPPDTVERIAFVMAFPPCTDVAVSGARHFKAKGLRKLTDALDLFNACMVAAEWSRAPYFIENPVGVLSSHVRKPDHIFQPWHYGDLESKATCLWTGGGFVMPTPIVTEKPAGVLQSCWRMPPSDDRGDLRSVTPEGFAQAVFESNTHPTPTKARTA
jgi:hypothetical protein